MGNSNGSPLIITAFEAHHGLQGFIWEWIDYGLVRTNENGEEYGVWW